jgi:lipopolysaccharide transport system ATP-binding protein
MSDTVIKVENLSKQYRLGNVGLGTLNHDLNRWWYNVRGKEDPYLKIGEENDRTTKGSSEYVWALRDINFEVQKGEVLGIIGRNGAGKSTLLKILSRTTTPSTGQVKIKGRVASLLEVGTGFHPELTGRENIFLNGAILGMTKHEIKSKFDEIVDFSGVERYIDTPVKRYSSGMYVRLAFGVAAHLEPEILIVDEVLAVGDAEFQKKALGKMKDVSTKEGRTVLFVSHNMPAIRSLCSRAVSLEKGTIMGNGDVEKVTINYLQKTNTPSLEFTWEDVETIHGIKLLKFFVQDLNDNPLTDLTTDKDIKIAIQYKVMENDKRFGFTIGFWNEFDELIFLTLSNLDNDFFNYKDPGIYTSNCTIPANFLNDHTYSVSLNIFDANYQNGVTFKDVLMLSIGDGMQLRKDYLGGFQGMIRPSFPWNTQKIN